MLNKLHHHEQRNRQSAADGWTYNDLAIGNDLGQDPRAGNLRVCVVGQLIDLSSESLHNLRTGLSKFVRECLIIDELLVELDHSGHDVGIGLKDHDHLIGLIFILLHAAHCTGLENDLGILLADRE
jgi:hypothetical protein